MIRRDFFKAGAISLLAWAQSGCDEKPAAQSQAIVEEEVLEEGIGANISRGEPKDHIFQDHGLKRPVEVVADADEFALMRTIEGRLKRIIRYVGFGNFNVIDYDSVLRTAANVSTIGAFSPEEIAYIDRLFHRDGADYGFYGEKVSKNLTETIDTREIFKVPYTGHFLYKGRSAEVYDQVKKDVGESIILTSGVRGVPKQLHLFLAKAIECNGNYSEASRSLAPAGYSYHGVGDFDVGKVGFGHRNFTAEFAKTYEYDRLMKLGYVAIRYPQGNPFGVYFEPWHIEVV